MINYCTDQWLIVKYPCGAGGKFLINALFLFDKVPHWHGNLSQPETLEYFKNTICNFTDPQWLNREINHQWGTNFFSRSYLRNNDLSCQEFSQLVANYASTYFNSCWTSNLDIVDHWAKPILPKFWQNANSIDIVIDDYNKYQEFLVSKLYQVADDKIVSLLDVPALGTDTNQQYTIKFNNQFEFFDVSWDSFFENHVKNLPWLNPWLDYTPSGYYYTLSELLDRSKFIEKFAYFEDFYQQQIPVKYLITLHDTWTIANEQQQKLCSTR